MSAPVVTDGRGAAPQATRIEAAGAQGLDTRPPSIGRYATGGRRGGAGLDTRPPFVGRSSTGDGWLRGLRARRHVWTARCSPGSSSRSSSRGRSCRGCSPGRTRSPACPPRSCRRPSLAHFFGTDAIGRDLFTRVVYGAVHSLSGALVAVTVGLVAGTLLGVLAGSLGGVVDEILMRLVDVLLAIPGLLLALSIIILLGFGTVNAAIAVGVGIDRRLRPALAVRGGAGARRPTTSRPPSAAGARCTPCCARHVLPNSLTAVVGLAALQFGAAILAISTLGFLGYGAPPPTPEWGLLIAEGRNYVATSWWLTVLPGLVVVVVVLSANRISHSLGRTR